MDPGANRGYWHPTMAHCEDCDTLFSLCQNPQGELILSFQGVTLTGVLCFLSDMIAIPDFAAGAMENWGLITYRETALLYDPEVSSTSNKQRVAVVVSHELAHQVYNFSLYINKCFLPFYCRCLVVLLYFRLKSNQMVFNIVLWRVQYHFYCMIKMILYETKLSAICFRVQ